MSRFVRSFKQPSLVNAASVCQIICNVLPTYSGCLSASDACGVCNLRSKGELIYSCKCWTCSYGTSLIFCLPTTEYNEFTFRMSGICVTASTINYHCIGFGNDTCFCDGSATLVCGMGIRAICASLWNAYCCDKMIICGNSSGGTGCNSFGYEITLKKSHYRCNNVGDPFIEFCGSASQNNSFYGPFLFSGLDGSVCPGSSAAACSRCWGTCASSTTQFTRMCIQSNCLITPNDVSGAYWHIYGVRR